MIPSIPDQASVIIGSLFIGGVAGFFLRAVIHSISDFKRKNKVKDVASHMNFIRRHLRSNPTSATMSNMEEVERNLRSLLKEWEV